MAGGAHGYGGFPYDLFTLMAAVRERSALWDKDGDDYRNKMARRNAWDEVCAELEPRYDDMDDGAKRKLLRLVTARWANIRDAFMRSLKLDKTVHRPYLYRDQLRFLLKGRRPPSDSPDPEEGVQEMEDTTLETIEDQSNVDPLECQYRPRVKRRFLRSGHRFSVKRPKPERAEVDEDLAFFQSLLTHVKGLTASEKMEFRIGVLTMLQQLSKRGDDEEEDFSGKLESS